MTWMTLNLPIRCLVAPVVGLVLLALAAGSSIAPVSVGAQDRPVRDPFATGAGAPAPAGAGVVPAPPPDPFGAPPGLANSPRLAADRAEAEAAAMAARSEPEATTLVTEMFEVPAEALVRHLTSSGLETDDAGLREEVDALLANGEATRLSVEAITVSGPFEASSHAVREIIYPTAFSYTPGPSYPYAFETRNAGTGLSINGVAWREGALQLGIRRDSTRLVARPDLSQEPADTGAVSTRHPVFETSRAMLDLNGLQAGSPALIEISTPLQANGLPSEAHRRLLFLTATRLPGQQRDEPPLNAGRLTLFWVEVEWGALDAWVSQQGPGAVASGLWPAVDGWLREGSANLADSDIIGPLRGGRAESESVLELIYPTEYTAPDTPESPSLPKAFETRNAGSNAEVSFGPPNAAVPFVELAVSLVFLEGESVYRHYRKADKVLPAISQPRFATADLESRVDLSVLTGQPVLLGLVPAPPELEGDDGSERKSVVLFGRLTP